jgi:hypothetical protein
MFVGHGLDLAGWIWDSEGDGVWGFVCSIPVWIGRKGQLFSMEEVVTRLEAFNQGWAVTRDIPWLVEHGW